MCCVEGQFKTCRSIVQYLTFGADNPESLSVDTMADLARNLKRRTAAKGWLTRAVNALQTLIADPDGTDEFTLSDAVQEFDKRLSTLDDVQSKIECDLPNEELDADIEAAANFRAYVRECRMAAGKLLRDMSAANNMNKPPQSADSDASSVCGSISNSSHDSRKVEARLPKLELPKFSGNVKEWPSFWDQYKAIVHDTDILKITKFTYLRSLLLGEASDSIKGLALTDKNYEIACDLLEDRFGRKEQIVFAHIQDLMNLSVPSKYNVSSLRKVEDELLSHVRSLETYNITGDTYGVILTPLILSRLPPDLRLEWACNGAGHESDLEFLLSFLKLEIQRRERSQTFRELRSPVVAEEKRKPHAATAAALQTRSESVNNQCNICHKGHPTEKCWDLTRVSLDERQEKMSTAGLCFRCLNKGHISKNCNKKCARCHGRHNVLLCKFNGTVSQTQFPSGTKFNTPTPTHPPASPSSPTASSPSEAQPETSIVSASHVTSSKVSMRLQVRTVLVAGRMGAVEANVLFDTGADRSYISRDLVKRIGPECVGSQYLAYSAFGTGKSSGHELRNVFAVDAKGIHGSCETLILTEVPQICAPIFQPAVSEELICTLQSLGVTGVCNESSHMQVDILLGLDCYWKFMSPKLVTVSDGLVAQETVFGWIVSGPVRSSLQSHSVVSLAHSLLCLNYLSDDTLRCFWDLESIGVSDCPVETKHPVLTEFQEKVTFSDGRYHVGLPWKPGFRDKLQGNEVQAKCRLDRMTLKMEKTPSLAEEYHKCVQDMLASGIVEVVPEAEMVSASPVFYLPHRPVVKSSSLTTKVRPVFDASSAGPDGVSLNDCLLTGPSMLPNLAAILVRFRRWKVALTADISKAFLQVGVHREDQDVHRFLWNDHGVVRTMRFVRVPFGNKSSPFLLNATIQRHLSSVASSPVVEELRDNFYVDDLLTGADNEDDACQVLREVKDVMAQAGMKLDKYGSNSEVVTDMVLQEFDSRYSGQDVLKVLGLKWLAQEDQFTFEVVDFPPALMVTKRVVLSCIARLFDPLGFLTPFVMVAKCILQEIWKLGLDWDSEIPDDLKRSFERCLRGLNVLSTWKVPRSYTGLGWSAADSVELHAFGDASGKGYGACVFVKLTYPDGVSKTALVMSKARVAPVKKVTLPRLELLGALLCVRLLQFVHQSLKLSAETRSWCWTDSMVVLNWIQGSADRWKPFVQNRVLEIQSLSSPGQWRHCPGIDNPADLVSRGMFAEDLIQSDLWLSGPSFLLESDHMVMQTSQVMSCAAGPTSDVLAEVLADAVPLEPAACPVADDSQEPLLSTCAAKPSLANTLQSKRNFSTVLFDTERWGSFKRALRVVAWCL